MVRINLSLATIFTAALMAAAALSSSLSAATKATVAVDYGKLPLIFEPNQGQTDERVKFLSRGRGYSLFLTESEAVLSLRGAEGKSHALRVKLLGAEAAPKMTGLDRLAGVSNYFLGNDPKKWRTGVPHYAKVGYQGVYPGIDLVFYGTGQRQLEYDFIVAPGADPSAIKLGFEGAERLEIDENGDLIAHLPGGEVRFLKPVIYQEADGAKRPVAGGYALKDGRVTFDLAAYDPAKPLVIDPVLAYSTYLGGPENEYRMAIAVEPDCASNCEAYVTGQAFEGFPTTKGAFQETIGGSEEGSTAPDAFITKLNADGTDLVYSTYLGGASGDRPYGLAVDEAGSVYLVGNTHSTDFPTTSGAIQTCSSDSDSFMAKLDPSGQLAYATCFGNDIRFVRVAVRPGCALEPPAQCFAYIVGLDSGGNFPTTPDAVSPCFAGDGLFAILDPNADVVGDPVQNLVYSTCLGGSAGEIIRDIAVSGDGRAYLAGSSNSWDFPTTEGAFQETNVAGDVLGILAVIDPTVSGEDGLRYASFMPAKSSVNVAVDNAGRAYLAGTSQSFDFPTTAGAFQEECVPLAKEDETQKDVCGSVVLTVIDPAGNSALDLVYATYLGGSVVSSVRVGCCGGGKVVVVDAMGRAYMTGSVAGEDFPTRDPILSYGGSWDAFVAVLAPKGNGPDDLVFASHLGGEFGDSGWGIAVDGAGEAYVTGITRSREFPTTDGAFQTRLKGAKGPPTLNTANDDAFVAKISFAEPPPDDGGGGGKPCNPKKEVCT